MPRTRGRRRPRPAATRPPADRRRSPDGPRESSTRSRRGRPHRRVLRSGSRSSIATRRNRRAARTRRRRGETGRRSLQELRRREGRGVRGFVERASRSIRHPRFPPCRSTCRRRRSTRAREARASTPRSPGRGASDGSEASPAAASPPRKPDRARPRRSAPRAARDRRGDAPASWRPLVRASRGPSLGFLVERRIVSFSRCLALPSIRIPTPIRSRPRREGPGRVHAANVPRRRSRST